MIPKLADTFGIIIAIFTSLLVVEELYDFFVEKPTSTSMEVDRMRASSFPRVLVCQTPAYDMNAIQKNGYSSAFWYTAGKNATRHFVGWSGKFENETKSIVNEMVFQNSSSAPPTVLLTFRNITKYSFQKVKLIIARALYPFGKCFTATVPHEAREKTVVGLLLKDKLLNESLVAKNYKIFFLSLLDDAQILLPPFQKIGDDVRTHSQDIGYQQFRTRIMKTIHVENDPQ